MTGSDRSCVALSSVLVIEDDPDMQELQRMTLEGSGYLVIAAHNGLEGLRRLQSTRPCLILLDLMMPVMDGLTFLATRGQEGIGADVPVVCLSAGGPELMAEARRLGAVACLHKPTDFEELCGVVEKYCPGER